VNPEDVGPLVPFELVAVAVTTCCPGASGLPGVQVQFPFASAVAVQAGLPSTDTFTVDPGSAVPEIVVGF